MYIQLLIFILAYCSYLVCKKNNILQNNIVRKNYIIFIMILFIIQSGFRHLAVGDDTFAYYEMFEGIKRTNWSDLFNAFFTPAQTDIKDPGYHILQKFFASILPSYRLFLIAIAILFFSALGKILYKYTNSITEVLVAAAVYQCLYYSFMSITGLRQTIATAFLLFSVPYLIDKKWIKGAILILLAATQHKSALLFCGFAFLPYIKNSRLLLISAFIGFIPMLLYGGQIAEFFIEGTQFEQYSNYLNQYEGAGAYSFMVFILLLSACLFFQNKHICMMGAYNYIFINAIAIALFLTPLTMINPSNMRIVQYYSIFALITLPLLCTAYNNKVNFNVYEIVFLVLAIYTVFFRHAEYGFFWQKMQLNPVYGFRGFFNDFSL